MRDQYFEYYKPSEEELKRYWKECIFVLDANVLLDLYRYSEESRNELLRILVAYKDRLWIPAQVALEFH